MRPFCTALVIVVVCSGPGSQGHAQPARLPEPSTLKLPSPPAPGKLSKTIVEPDLPEVPKPPPEPKSALPPIATSHSGLPRSENLRRFNPHLVRLRWQDGRWWLEGGGLHKDFGRRQEEARQALQLIRSLDLDQRGTIGKPQPLMEYWLHRGKAPGGFTPGMRMIPIDGKNMAVDKVEGQWFLAEGRKALFRFGPHEQEARQALAVIQKYNFDHIGIVGQATPSMLIFLKRKSSLADHGRFDLSPYRKTTAAPSMIQQASHREEESEKKPLKRVESALPISVIPPLRPEGQKARPDLIRSKIIRPKRFRSPFSRNQLRNDPDDPVALDRVAFDYRQARIERDGLRWKLMVGRTEIADFGLSERQARIAMAAITHYRLSSMHLIGGENPVARYFLSGGSPPRGIMHGLIYDRFRPESLRIQQRGEHYHLYAAARPLLDCGPEKKNAQYIMDVIHKYRFDRLCRIGANDKETLRFFVKSY